MLPSFSPFFLLFFSLIVSLVSFPLRVSAPPVFPATGDLQGIWWFQSDSESMVSMLGPSVYVYVYSFREFRMGTVYVNYKEN